MWTALWCCWMLGGCAEGEGASGDEGSTDAEGGGGEAATPPGTSSTSGTQSAGSTPTTGPALRIDPSPLDMGPVDIPCATNGALRLENVGDEDLVIESVDFSGSGNIVVDLSELPEVPFTIPPGAVAPVTFHAEAPALGTMTSELVVGSNDVRGPLTGVQTVEGVYADSLTEVFVGPTAGPLDVLLLIDQKGEMEANHADDLAVGVPLLLAELERQAHDWHMLLVVEDSACAVGGVLDPAVDDAAELIVDRAFSARIGQKLLTEQLLRQADAALLRDVPGGCNEGLLRPGADLLVVVVSDGPELSHRTPDVWLDRLGARIDDPALLTVSGVVDASDCGEGDDGYDTAIALSGGTAIDLCVADWGADLASVIEPPTTGSTVYPLAEPALEASIVVTVDGVVALAEYDAVVAAGHHVLGGEQELLDRRTHATLQEHRAIGLADLRQEREVLHVAGADLQ